MTRETLLTAPDVTVEYVHANNDAELDEGWYWSFADAGGAPDELAGPFATRAAALEDAA
jgi:hypothetical protein